MTEVPWHQQTLFKFLPFALAVSPEEAVKRYHIAYKLLAEHDEGYIEANESLESGP
jgi:hypothetical protein